MGNSLFDFDKYNSMEVTVSRGDWVESWTQISPSHWCGPSHSSTSGRSTYAEHIQMNESCPVKSTIRQLSCELISSWWNLNQSINHSYGIAQSISLAYHPSVMIVQTNTVKLNWILYTYMLRPHRSWTNRCWWFVKTPVYYTIDLCWSLCTWIAAGIARTRNTKANAWTTVNVTLLLPAQINGEKNKNKIRMTHTNTL